MRARATETVEDLALSGFDPDARPRADRPPPRFVTFCRVIGCGRKWPLQGVCGVCRAAVRELRAARESLRAR